MKLYHWTQQKYLESIFEKGLLPNGMGIVYLTPEPKTDFGEVLLEVETGGNKLTAFDDCREWEIFCWGEIPPKNIKVICEKSQSQIPEKLLVIPQT